MRAHAGPVSCWGHWEACHQNPKASSPSNFLGCGASVVYPRGRCNTNMLHMCRDACRNYNARVVLDPRSANDATQEGKAGKAWDSVSMLWARAGCKGMIPPLPCHGPPSAPSQGVPGAGAMEPPAALPASHWVLGAAWAQRHCAYSLTRYPELVPTSLYTSVRSDLGEGLAYTPCQ